MSGQYPYLKWDKEVFDTLNLYEDVIRDVAKHFDGISAEALAGAMAKELHSYLNRKELDDLFDKYTGKRLQKALVCDCPTEYQFLKENDLIDRAWGLLKAVFPLMADVGRFNTQLATAKRAVDRYGMTYDTEVIDPLDLKDYVGRDNCEKLFKGLTGKDGMKEAVRLAATIWGLRMKKAKDWFENKVNQDPQSKEFWDSLPQAMKDALYGQWVICGEVVMDQLYDKNMQNFGYYKPALGKGDSGSYNILGNSKDIGKAMGDPQYGTDLSEYHKIDYGIYAQDIDLLDLVKDIIAPPCEYIDRAQDAWNRAPGAGGFVYSDPLVLDLDRDGVETVGVNLGPLFDHNGDGFAEVTGWVDPDDGFLVMDRNGDGVINDGKEFFGDLTVLNDGRRAANGFEALAELDGNNDGRIDTNDPGFSHMKVWKDVDRDGYSLPSELHTLDELGITAINLDSTPDSTTDPQGNTRTRVGSFEWTDGSNGEIAEYGLERDTVYVLATEWQDVPEDIAALPDLRAYGNVYDLHQAMVRDTSAQLASVVEQFVGSAQSASGPAPTTGGQLKSLVGQFVGAPDPTSRNALTEQILFTWTGSEAIDPQSRGANIDARRLGVLEEFFGQSFVGRSGPNPTYEASIHLNESYRLIFEGNYASLMKQTHLKDLYNTLEYTCCGETGEYQIDTSGLITALQQNLDDDPEQGKQLLSEFARSRRGMGFHDENCFLSVREHFIQQDPDLGWMFDTGGLPVYDAPHQGSRPESRHIEGTDNADAVKGSLTVGDRWLNGLNGNDVIYGTSRHEYLINESGDGILVGGGGYDTIRAGAGDDILDGGADKDRLYGEEGNDTYLFRTGSGKDVILETDTTPDNRDTIWIGSFLTPDDIAVKRTEFRVHDTWFSVPRGPPKGFCYGIPRTVRTDWLRPLRSRSWWAIGENS